MIGLDCEVGMRKRTCYVLSGSVLSVWKKLEGIFSLQPGSGGKMQIIRLRLDDGTKIVGKWFFICSVIWTLRIYEALHE